MTVEVHHLSRLALKCNLLGDRRQARRKHRQLHLGHPTSLGQLSPPRNRSAHYRSKGTQKTPGTSGGQRLDYSRRGFARSGPCVGMSADAARMSAYATAELDGDSSVTTRLAIYQLEDPVASLDPAGRPGPD